MEKSIPGFYKLLLFLIVVCGTIPYVGAFPPPVPDPNIQVCGDVNYFFWNDSSDFGASYQRLATYPQLQDNSKFSASVSSATSPKIMGSFVTDAFPNGAVMAPGLSRFRTFLNVSSATGTTDVQFVPYLIAANGTQYPLWYGVARTEEVNDADTAPTEFLTSYARRNYTYFEPGSRFMIRVNGSSTSAVVRTVSINVAGTNYASMVQVGHWLCSSNSTNTTAASVSGGAADIVFPLIFGMLGGMFVIAGYLRRRRK